MSAPTTPTTAHLLWAQRVLAIVRIAIGWIFLWAFLDKCFGIRSDTAWVFGTSDGNPTLGYLSSIDGWFAWLYNPMAGLEWVNWLFMLGLLGIGIGLMTGLAFRFSAICGIVMFFLMYLSALPQESTPVVDEHFVYGVTLLGLLLLGNGAYWGLSRPWNARVGRALPWLK